MADRGDPESVADEPKEKDSIDIESVDSGVNSVNINNHCSQERGEGAVQAVNNVTVPPEFGPKSVLPEVAMDTEIRASTDIAFKEPQSEPQENSHCPQMHGDNAHISGDPPAGGAVGGISAESACDVDIKLDASSKEQTDPDESVSFGKLKKDDSGIDVERSPVREGGSHTGDSENDTSQRDTISKETGEQSTETLSEVSYMRVDRPSVSNESEGLVADYSDPDDSDEAEVENIAKLSSDKDTGKHDSDTDSSSDSDNDLPQLYSLRRKRHAPSALMSSSDQDDDSSSREEESASERRRRKWEETREQEEDIKIDLTPPRDTWCPLKQLEWREIGCGNKVPQSRVFAQRCTASVNLVQRLSLHTKLEDHEGCVNALHFNKSGTLLASGSDDQQIVVWDWRRSRPFFKFYSGHRSNVFQSKFMPYTGDTHIVSCARDGQVRVAELSSTGTCKATKKLAQHKGAAHKLALLEDSSHVFYSAGEDAVVYEIDLRQDKPNKLCTAKEGSHKVALYSIHSNPFKSHEFCVGGRDLYIRVYDSRMIGEENEGVVKKYCPQRLVGSEVKANITCCVYNYNGTEILGSYNDEDLYLFDTTHSDGADAIHKYTGHRNNATVKGVNFYGAKSEFVVSGSDCSNVFLWEKESEKVVQCFHADEGGVVNVLEPHPLVPMLATSGLDHDIKIWMPTAKEPTKLDELKEVIQRNMREREDDRMDHPDMIDGHMFWQLMQHFRRRARRETGDASDSSAESEPETDEPDDEDENPEPMQCVPS